MDAISHLECKLNRLALTLCPPTPLEPTEEVLHQYTNTLCTAQKKTSFVNSLLQDIAILNGNDSSQLEDCLIDIKTTSHLTGESRTKLAQAKSKGLICTLISEALTSNKTWDEIKDSLHLKICNLDIHTSVSHFMEIQQKEYLAAYIHQFKREANRCKFDNNAATIRIFIKGLRNAHTLVTWAYEKGRQSLADAIREVEKLQAEQQLTATLLPSSSVNVMSSDDDKCFQCQESGHMACHCPRIKCLDCDEYGHVVADCPDKILPSCTPARHRNTHSNTRHHDRSISHHIIRTIIGLTGQDPIPAVIDTEVTVGVIHREVAPCHITDAHTEAHHATDTQAHIAFDEILHIEDLHHTEVFLHIPEITVDPDNIPHTKMLT